MNAFPAWLALPLLGLGLLFIFSVAQHTERQFQRRREEAMAAFRAVRLESADPRYSFSGAAATIVKQEEVVNRREPDQYMLTVFARNEFGEYFMFKATQPRPYVKHVEHRIAKVVLKAAYVPPPDERHH